jgi:sugar phosphate permease
MKRSGWASVIASWFCLFAGASSIIVFTFGNFLRALTAEFGWSRGLLSNAFACSALAAAIATPILGWLVDRYGIRRVTLPGIVIGGLAVMTLAANNGSAWVLFVTLPAAGALTVALTALPYTKAITNWFDQRRGLALGIATLGGSIGVAVVPQLTQSVISTYGWRTAYIFLGVLVLVVAFLPALIFLHDRERNERADAATVAANTPGFSAHEGRRQWRLWVICAAFLLAAAGASGIIGQLVPLLTDRGVGVENATRMIAVFAIGSAIARMFSGVVLDYVFAPYVGALSFLGGGIGLVLFVTSNNPSLLIVATALCGLSIGVEYDLLPYTVSRYMGMRAYGELVGYCFTCFVIGTGIVGPLMMGNSFSLLGSYNPSLTAFACFLFIAAVLLLTLGPYTYPASRKHE